jgi:hypothetical protein
VIKCAYSRFLHLVKLDKKQLQRHKRKGDVQKVQSIFSLHTNTTETWKGHSELFIGIIEANMAGRELHHPNL